MSIQILDILVAIMTTVLLVTYMIDDEDDEWENAIVKPPLPVKLELNHLILINWRNF